MSTPARLEFDIGPVLSRGFSIFLRNLPAFLVMAAIVYAPLIAWAYLGPNPAEAETYSEATSQMLRFSMVSGVGGMLLAPVLSGAVTYAVVEELAGRRPSLGANLATGLRRMLPTLAVGVVAALAIGGATLLLVVPGLMVACAYYVAVPVAVIERPGVLASLRRSAELTRGRRWWIFALFLVAAMIGGAFVFVLDLALVDKIGPGFGALVEPDDWTTYVTIQVANWVVSGALGATLVATAYVGLRNSHDGVGVDELARVFD